MSDDRFDEWLNRQAKDYHAPPPTPRDAMWARIEAQRVRQRVTVRRFAPRTRVLVPLGLAATLILGVALGRWTAHQGAATPSVAAAPSGGAGVPALNAATVEHLSRSEVFLTGFRTEAATGQGGTDFQVRARQLLVTTRLLLDSPELTDPRLKALLEDLELILAQISQLPAAGKGQDLDLINQGLEQRGTLPRLRTLVPAGSATAALGAS